MTITEIGLLVNGTIEGNLDTPIVRPDKIEDAQEGSITFLANPKYEHYLYTTKASAILVPINFNAIKPIAPTLIRVEQVYEKFAILLQVFEKKYAPPRGIAHSAILSPSVQLGKNGSIGDFVFIHDQTTIGNNYIIYPQVYIGANVKIGNHVTIYPGVKILANCIIGNNCIIHPNAVIGSEGFGFAPQKDGSYKKIPQVGNVILEDDVEVGANTTIDRATMGATIIKKGTKLDNLIQIAHNVSIGSNTVIAAQAGVAGSTKIGAHCQIGGQAGIVGHLNITDKVRIQAQSGVTKSINKEGTAIYGYPAIAYNDYLKSYAYFKQLPALVKRIEELEEQLSHLKSD